jgi:hypothetical protein
MPNRRRRADAPLAIAFDIERNELGTDNGTTLGLGSKPQSCPVIHPHFDEFERMPGRNRSIAAVAA